MSPIEESTPKAYGVVYLVRNTVNGKVHVGQTTLGHSTRWSEHKSVARCGSNLRFHQAIRKHGEQAFKVEVIDQAANSEELDAKETTAIQFYQAFQYDRGYNMKPTAWGMSPEMREKMRGPGNSSYGKPMPDGHQEKLQDAVQKWRTSDPTTVKASYVNVGYLAWSRRSEEDKARVRDSFSGANNPHFGKPLTEERKKVLIEATRARREALGPEGRRAEALHASSFAAPKLPCSVCGEPQHGLGLCDKHYQRFKKSGDPNVVIGQKVLGRCLRCDKDAISRSLCGRHYMEAKRLGVLPPVKRNFKVKSVNV